MVGNIILPNGASGGGGVWTESNNWSKTSASSTVATKTIDIGVNNPTKIIIIQRNYLGASPKGWDLVWDTTDGSNFRVVFSMDSGAYRQMKYDTVAMGNPPATSIPDYAFIKEISGSSIIMTSRKSGVYNFLILATA